MQGLKELGFQLIFLTRSAESFYLAWAERVKVCGNPSQYNDLQVFVHAQEVMETIVEWVVDSGGLYVAER
jgi:hypothetical protein